MPIFRLQGGPGLTNMDFPEAKRFTAHHDFVLVGYRGVDGSSRLDCPEVVASIGHSRDLLGNASLAANASAYRACAKRLQDKGVDLAGYSLVERVDDLELARNRLGYGPIDLISESAGTRTAMIYAWRYPQSIHRSVMVAANPPGNYLWNAKTTDEQIHRYAAVCAQAQDCRSRTNDLAASIHSAYAKIPGRFLFLPIKKGNVRVAGFFGLINATAAGGGPLAAPKTIDTLLSIDKGNGAAGAWLLSLFAGVALPHGQVWGDVASIARIDAAHGRRLFASGVDHGSILGNPGTKFLWSGGRLLNAWPANPDEKEYNSVRNSNVRTLLINGQLDFAAPPELATRQLLPHLPNGHQVVLPHLGHADDFWAYEPDASTRLIDSYLDNGRVDTSRYTTNQLDFTPSTPTQARSPRSSSASSSASPASSSSLSSGSHGGFAAARRSDGRRASSCGRCSRCCSVSAAGAWACWSPWSRFPRCRSPTQRWRSSRSPRRSRSPSTPAGSGRRRPAASPR